MKVKLLTELWLTDSDGQLCLGTPTVVRSSTGEGVPGLVMPRPLHVYKPGEVVELSLLPPCGCTTVVKYDSGAEVLQHECGRSPLQDRS